MSYQPVAHTWPVGAHRRETRTVTAARDNQVMTLLSSIPRWSRNLLSLSAFSVVVAACVDLVWKWPASWQPWYSVVRNFGVLALYTFFIAAAAWTVAPALMHKTWPRHSVLRWPMLLAALAASAVIGSAAGSEVVVAFHIFRLVTFKAAFRESVSSTVPITLVLGVVVTAFESVRGRLRDTELELGSHRLQSARLEKLAAEAQLASLAARVQPHFLFNTLNSISALIREDPDQAERTVERLSALLRSSLDPKETVPLHQELKLVGDYLEIQRTRLGDRLRYDMEVKMDQGSSPTVPPFAVQTVVENALKHVAAQRQEGVALHLSARRSGGDLVVEVTDDGPGFDPDSVKAGHGLDNLQGRLRALYGEHARLEFLRRSGGMTVRLCVPAQ